MVLSVTIVRWGWTGLCAGVAMFTSWCQKRVWLVGKRRNNEPIATCVHDHPSPGLPALS